MTCCKCRHWKRHLIPVDIDEQGDCQHPSVNRATRSTFRCAAFQKRIQRA